MRRVVAALTLALLALVATAAGATAASTTSDQELARAGVLRRSDFPAGWKQSSRDSTDDASTNAQAAKISSCKPFAAFSKANQRNPRAKSPNFEESQSKVNNTVSLYPSTAKAVAAMATFADSRLPTCFEKLFNAVFKAQLARNKAVAKQLKSVKTDIRLVDGLHIGDQAIAYEGSVDVGLKDGSTQTAGLGLVSVRVGSTLAGYSYTSDVDISAALQPAIVASVTRLTGAQPPA